LSWRADQPSLLGVVKVIFITIITGEMDKLDRQILQLLSKHELSAGVIAILLKKPRSKVRYRLLRLAAQGLLEYKQYSPRNILWRRK